MLSWKSVSDIKMLSSQNSEDLIEFAIFQQQIKCFAVFSNLLMVEDEPELVRKNFNITEEQIDVLRGYFRSFPKEMQAIRMAASIVEGNLFSACRILAEKFLHEAYNLMPNVTNFLRERVSRNIRDVTNSSLLQSLSNDERSMNKAGLLMNRVMQFTTDMIEHENY